MIEGEEYFKGSISFGVLGDKEILILPNKKREGNQPHFKIVVKNNDNLINVGVLWKNKKKPNNTTEVKEETI
jgi:uncharacterized protein (DUF736 family)